MQRCDVLVVGGGPAGSSCASELRRAGLDVVVADRSTFPRDKPCAGWVTPAALTALRFDAEDYRRGGRVLQPIMGFRTSRMGGPEVSTRYDEVVSFGILRREFDAYLLARSGARLRLGRPVRRLQRAPEGWTLDDELFAPVVVGAGGHFCPVARQLAGELREQPVVVVAQEAEVCLDGASRDDCSVRPETPQLFFCSDRRGYGWCVRKGDWLNVGFGRQGERTLPSQVEAFIAFLRARMKLPADVSSAMKGHAYLLYDSSRRPLSGERFLLAGDAAGLAYPRSGEGIRPAIESGLLAARTLVAAGGRYGAEALAPYEEAVRSRLGRRRGGGQLPDGIATALTRWVLASGWWTRKLVIEGSFLRPSQPALASV
jgi:flavin-dependent dehydrogenase